MRRHDQKQAVDPPGDQRPIGDVPERWSVDDDVVVLVARLLDECFESRRSEDVVDRRRRSAREYHVERYFREIQIARIAPVSPQLVLSYIAERVLGLPKSY